MSQTEYQQCLSSMYQLRRFGIKLEMDTIKHILSALGNPQNNFRCIHIAGTNGKGSVAAMLSAILHEAGYRVGRYTSPHLEHFNERICIDNQPIADDAVIQAYEKVRQVKPGEREPTFFEFATAMALYEFGRQKVQWAVVETGMGGRMDATNAVQSALSIITNISLEHKDYLGRTIAAIAAEKAGIIKPGIPLVTAVRQGSARTVINTRATACGSTVMQKGRDFRTRREAGDRFTYFGLDHIWRKLSINLVGDHQIENAALALAACEILTRSGQARISEHHIRRGLENACWPGRLEIVSKTPCVIFDGAHNLMAARTLASHLTHRFKDRRITLVIGVLDDKPFRTMLKFLSAPCRRIIVTQPVIDRALPAPKLAETARQFSSSVKIVPDVGRALKYALESAPPDEVICVAGSLYVVGEAKTALKAMAIG